jgi:hypothetical protein
MPAISTLAVVATALVVVVLAVVVASIRHEPSAQELTRKAPRLMARLAGRLPGVYVRRPDSPVISAKYHGTGTAGNTGDGPAAGAELRTLFRVAAAPWSTGSIRLAVEQADLAAIAQHMPSLVLRNVAGNGFVFADPGNRGSFSVPGCVIAPPSRPRTSRRDESCLLPIPVQPDRSCSTAT